jgi:hypothetical protein
VRGEGEGLVNALLATAAVVPVLATHSLAAEQVTQLVLGEGAEVVDHHGAMLRIRTILDDYAGWVHEGYVRRLHLGDVEAWLSTAAWSEGALLRDSTGMAIRAPHRARLLLEGSSRTRLPDGDVAEILGGSVRPYGDVILGSLAQAPSTWAWREFAGAPYLWGGVTASGIDCSGLVQTTFLARGVPLPRDARQQVDMGQRIELEDRRPDDLLFFRGADSDGITHVAIQAGDDGIVHSTVATGRVTREAFTEGSRAAPLLERLVAVRRLT